jgi:hypothetical protein
MITCRFSDGGGRSSLSPHSSGWPWGSSPRAADRHHPTATQTLSMVQPTVSATTPLVSFRLPSWRCMPPSAGPQRVADELDRQDPEWPPMPLSL